MDSASEYAARCYAEGTTDEFLPPVVIGGTDGIFTPATESSSSTSAPTAPAS